MKKPSKWGVSDSRLAQSEDEDLEGNNYEPSDSDDAYTEKEKKLLNKTRHVDSGASDSEEEVFGIDSDNDDNEDVSGEEDDADEINMDSDIEGNEEDSLPNVRAWGKSKKTFYNTDYVDEDYGGFQGKDAQEAEYEEQEARVIQRRLAQQLDDADFSFDFFGEEHEKEDSQEKSRIQEKEQVKTDLSSLSKRQKLEILQKEAPEFLSIVQDFSVQMQELAEKLEPVLLLIKERKLPTSPATHFIKTRYHLILNYCTNILFYLLLKARRMPVQSHPIVRRLVQYRQLLQQLQPLWTDTVKPQCEQLLKMVDDGQDILPTTPNTPRKAAKKLLKILKSPSAIDEEDEQCGKGISMKPQSKRADKKVAKSTKKQLNAHISSSREEHSDDHMEVEEQSDGAEEVDSNKQTLRDDDDEQQEDTKRGITYQMAKNKGLTPHRKKEQRNPRVKNRNKYRKALIRRKGQVRSVRTEVERYGGEIFGIKTRVKKGIKIKV